MINATGSRRRTVFIATVAALFAALAPSPSQGDRALACGGCDPLQDTLSEEIAASGAAVICKLAFRPGAAQAEVGAAPECVFEVVESLKGPLVAKQPIKILYAGNQPVDSTFYARAEFAGGLVWYTPDPIGPREVDYLRKLGTLPAAGPARLLVSYDYLEAPEPLLASDAYETFARASYADVAATKARMPREKLLAWIADVNIQSAHRKQYLYMLAICGTADDLPKLEELLRRGDQATSRILEAVIGCYLVLRRADGLPLIEQLFLTDRQAEFVDTFAAIKALRFTAVESQSIPRERINQSLRLVLDRPQLADLVVADFFRGRDWSVAPQLAALYRKAEKDQALWVRIPIAEYFRLCPTPAGAALRSELEKLDAEPFARAAKLYGDHGPATDTTEQPAQ